MKRQDILKILLPFLIFTLVILGCTGETPELKARRLEKEAQRLEKEKVVKILDEQFSYYKTKTGTITCQMHFQVKPENADTLVGHVCALNDNGVAWHRVLTAPNVKIIVEAGFKDFEIQRNGASDTWNLENYMKNFPEMRPKSK